MLFAAAVELILVHMIDGRAVEINPSQITQMVQAREPGNPKKQFADKVSCLIRFTDGSYLSVAESCKEVKALAEGFQP